MNRRIGWVSQKFFRIAAGGHRSRFPHREIHSICRWGKNTCEFMRNHHDGGAQTVAQLQNQIVEQARALIGSSPAEGSSKKNIRIQRVARARPEHICIPSLISRRRMVLEPFQSNQGEFQGCDFANFRQIPDPYTRPTADPTFSASVIELHSAPL